MRSIQIPIENCNSKNNPKSYIFLRAYNKIMCHTSLFTLKKNLHVWAFIYPLHTLNTHYIIISDFWGWNDQFYPFGQDVDLLFFHNGLFRHKNFDHWIVFKQIYLQILYICYCVEKTDRYDIRNFRMSFYIGKTNINSLS